MSCSVNGIPSGVVACMDIEPQIDYIDYTGVKFYMRRGNRFYFRNDNHKAVLIVDGKVRLKKGDILITR